MDLKALKSGSFLKVSCLWGFILLSASVNCFAQSEELDTEYANYKTATIYVGLLRCGQNFQEVYLTTHQKLNVLYQGYQFKERALGYLDVVSSQNDVPSFVVDELIPKLINRYDKLAAFPSCVGQMAPFLVRLNQKQVGSTSKYYIAMASAVVLLILLVFTIFKVTSTSHGRKKL